MRPPAAVAGKKGPAIGPVLPHLVAHGPRVGRSPAVHGADLKATATVDSVINGVSYGHLEAVANTTCAVAGPPVLQVQNVAGTAVSSVVILQHESTDGSQLPTVSTWGAVLKLQVRPRLRPPVRLGGRTRARPVASPVRGTLRVQRVGHGRRRGEPEP